MRTTRLFYVQQWSDHEDRWVTRRTPFTGFKEASDHAEQLATDRAGKTFRVAEYSSTVHPLATYGPRAGRPHYPGEDND